MLIFRFLDMKVFFLVNPLPLISKGENILVHPLPLMPKGDSILVFLVISNNFYSLR